MGHIIPAGTGFSCHRNIKIQALVEELPIEEPVPAAEQQPLVG
jgi:hypothetical protein